MKTCLICGENVGVDVQTCPKDGEASWSEASEKDEAPVAEPKKAGGKKKS